MSDIHKFLNNKNFQWEGVENNPIVMEGVQSAAIHILIGEKENAPNSIMRFIHLDPGGHSRLEQHPHEHEVIVLQGKGKIQIGNEISDVEPFDVVFVEGNALHQFSNPYDEVFGFICVIPKL
jgi:quercetin dioxygenase-like cupin family protein